MTRTAAADLAPGTGTRVVLCGEAAGDGADHPEEHVLRLRCAGPDRNVNLHVDDLRRSRVGDVPAQLADLVEVATYVYVADQAIGRGGNGVEDMGANWRRRLRFEVPVRCPDLWRQREVSDALRDALSFLSEDEYLFAFRPYHRPPPFTGYLNFAPAEAGGAGGADAPPERVVLFSGGLDSLGGAVQEVVVEGRPVVLVTHQATPKFVNRLRTLRQMIDQRAAGPRPLHVSIGINKDEGLSREYTQRSRSFLYASLGAAIARMCGLDDVRFYENGTVSLNLPISRQVVGSKATRTTHPRVLAGFARLFSLLTGRPVAVTNGFLWRTKAEVAAQIVAARCGGMIEWSTSCTHTWEVSNAKPHCGACSQCIDRRFAILAAGAGAFERPDSYGVDLLADARKPGEPRTMLASYVETAQQVERMSELEFFVRFGEVARVVRHLPGCGSADEAARRMYDLYRRHAQGVIRVVDEGLGQHVSQIRARSLPESCLLRLVHDPGVPSAGAAVTGTPASAGAAGEPEYFLRRRGQGWDLRFAGHEPQALLPSIGCVYLSELLRFPDKRFTVSELLVAAYGDKAAMPRGAGATVLNGQAKLAFARRLAELEEELEEANERRDLGRQIAVAVERERLLAEVKRLGFKTKAKRHDSDLNRVRNSVCNAIRRSLVTIKRFEPSAHAHLKESLSFGFSVTYQPAAPIPWSF